MRAIMMGVASTSRVPLPTVLAVSSGVTEKVVSREIPGCNMKKYLPKTVLRRPRRPQGPQEGEGRGASDPGAL